MIPILMQDETTVGFLKEAMSCVATEERNGMFELSLTYPVTGKMFPEIAIDRFVKAKPNDTADLQLFRIYEVSKPMNGVVTVNAEHVSYALAHFPVIEASITGTATQAINELLSLVRKKDYFVLTTNVDHCFQKAGFDKKRLFYTQGDYGLFQSVDPSINKTFDNEEWVMQAMAAQGFVRDANGVFTVPADRKIAMRIPTERIPTCPEDGGAVTMNLRSDDSFVEDDGWHAAAQRYENFLRTRTGKVLFLELGVGFNTPVIIKYPFWKLIAQNPQATYACVNYGEADCPPQIKNRSVCINADIDTVLRDLQI